MKRNVKKIFALVLVIMILCASVSVSADTGDIETRAVCIYCASNFTETKCLGNYYYYTSGPGTHLWGDCNVDFYRATAKEWCPGCGRAIETFTHDCYQVHSSCGRGKEWTCIALVSGGWDGGDPHWP